MPSPGNPPVLDLDAALRRYRWNLVVTALFPLFCFLGIEWFGMPPQVIMVSFFATFFIAAWPCGRQENRAPYSYWLVSCAVYMAGAVAAMLVNGLLKSLLR